MTALSLTYFKGLYDPYGQRVRTTWPKLIERLSVPRISADKHDVPGLSLATFAGDRRALANVEHVYAVGLDLDEGVSWAEVRTRFAGSASFVHSTWSSTLLEPRARVFLLLSRPVTGEEYRAVYASVTGVVEAGGLVVDRAASDPSRFWFLPCSQPGATFTCYVGEGPPVDAEAAIAAAPQRPPPSAPASRPLASGGPSAFDRARAYLAKCEPAIQGSGGRTVTFVTAQRLVRGFALTVEDAFTLMSEWNQRCQPPWSDRDLRVKCEEAAKAGRMHEGDMLARERAR